MGQEDHDMWRMGRSMKNKWSQLSDTVTAFLEDVSQIFFFRSAGVGFGLLVILYYFDRQLFLCGIAGALVGYTYTLNYNAPKILKMSGLITINGFFFGIAMASLFKASPEMLLILLLGALSIPHVTKAVYEILQHWNISVFIFPYIVSIWIICLCGDSLALIPRYDLWPNRISSLPPLHPEWPIGNVFVVATLQSMGRVLFVSNPKFGLAILALITAFSPRRGFYFLAGTFTTIVIACTISSGYAWEYGLVSYSAGLVGLGLASLPERVRAKNIIIFSIISCFLTMALQRAFLGTPIPVLSLPFVMSMWFAILSRTPRVNISWAQSKANHWRLGKSAEEIERVGL